MKYATRSVALLAILLAYALSCASAFQQFFSTEGQDIRGGLTITKWNPADVDDDLDVDIFDMVRCATAYGATPADERWDPPCDINEPYGIINIFDAVIIGINYGEEYTP